MAIFSLSTIISILGLLTLAQAGELTLTVVNNCPYTIWPGIQPNTGMPVLENGGFALNSNDHRSISTTPAPWSGRIWARTSCAQKDGKFSCATGDCGAKIECGGQGGTPSTLAEVAIHQGGNDGVNYKVSVVDGYNLPVTVTPHEGTGNCPVMGCAAKLLDTCPPELQAKGDDGKVVACRSGCKALNKPEFCCDGDFNTPDKCKPSSHSQFFKKDCPNSITYAFDAPADALSCASPKELKVIFCP